jgi:hypothetical protein
MREILAVKVHSKKIFENYKKTGTDLLCLAFRGGVERV